MEWRIVFWLVAIMLVGTNFVYVGFGSGNQQKWNEPIRRVNEVENPNFNGNDEQIKKISNA
jgi:hypothetical protein